MNIIQDTREQKGWDFLLLGDANVKSSTLGIADYTTENLKDLLRIERKASTSEIAINLTVKKDKIRFLKELEVLQSFKHPYIIFEFSESDVYSFPKKSGLPKKLKASIRFGGRALRKMIADMEEKFDIPVIFCSDRREAETVAYNIMSSLEKRYEGDLS